MRPQNPQKAVNSPLKASTPPPKTGYSTPWCSVGNAGRTTTWCSTTAIATRSSLFYPLSSTSIPMSRSFRKATSPSTSQGYGTRARPIAYQTLGSGKLSGKGESRKKSTPNLSLNGCGCCPMAELPVRYCKELSFGSLPNHSAFASTVASSTIAARANLPSSLASVVKAAAPLRPCYAYRP